MTREHLIRAISRMTSRDDLKAIEAALQRRRRILQEQEDQARYQTAWELAQSWAVGTVVYTTKPRMILFGDQRFAFKRGERLIVRKFMPRARAVLFEGPDRSDWQGGLYRADAEDLDALACQTNPPSISATAV